MSEVEELRGKTARLADAVNRMLRQTLALRYAREALEAAPQTCRYHDAEFGKLGWEPWGEPRCDSCKQPWRTVRALREIERVEKAESV